MTSRGSGSKRVSRRTALGFLGTAVGAAVASACRQGGIGRPPDGHGRQARGRTIIRTVQRDIAPAELGTGALLFHEHLSMNLSTPRVRHYTEDVDLMVAEARAARSDGLACIVDGGHPDMNRSIDALRRIMAESGLAVVASGGYYLQRFYPPELSAKSAELLAEELVQEARADRLGAFGEIGQSNEMTADERKVFLAVAKAHLATGVPIFTHNAYASKAAPPVPRDAALRQLDLLERAGVDPRHVAIGHVCCLDDPKAEVAREVAKRGAYVGFDRVTLEFLPDTQRIAMILALLDAGYGDHLLLSSDFSVEKALKTRGGPGLAQAFTVFGPRLRDAGVSARQVRSIFVDNPLRFLSFVPVVA